MLASTTVELFPFRFEERPNENKGMKIVVMASNLTLARGYVNKRLSFDMIYVGTGLPSDMSFWTSVNHK